MSQSNPVPAGYQTVTASLVVPDTRAAIALYQQVFDARQTELVEHSGSILHAEIRIGTSVLMLADANPDWDLKSAAELGGTPVSLYLYTADVDAQVSLAESHGFEVIMPPTDMFWGDRFGQVRDPFGHIWSVATHQEDLDEAEINRRMQAFFQQAQ